MRSDNWSEDLLAKQPVSGILRFDQRGLDEITVFAPGHAAGNDACVVASVLEILADLGESLFVYYRAHEISEIGDVSHLDVFHDRDGAVAHLGPDRLGDVDSARGRALLPLILESSAGDGDRESDRISGRMRDDEILAAGFADDARVGLVAR